MDFNKGLVNPKHKYNDGLVEGIVEYKNNVFTVLVRGISYEVNAYDYTQTILYSKPENDKHNSWTKKKTKVTVNKQLVSKYWSTIYNGQKVRGVIKNSEFIIKKY